MRNGFNYQFSRKFFAPLVLCQGLRHFPWGPLSRQRKCLFLIHLCTAVVAPTKFQLLGGSFIRFPTLGRPWALSFKTQALFEKWWSVLPRKCPPGSNWALTSSSPMPGYSLPSCELMHKLQKRFKFLFSIFCCFQLKISSGTCPSFYIRESYFVSPKYNFHIHKIDSILIIELNP